MRFDFFLVVLELSHEVQVWGYDTTARFDVFESSFQSHFGGVHEIREAYCSTAAHSSLTVYQNLASVFSNCICKIQIKAINQ